MPWMPGRDFTLRDGHGDPELSPAGLEQADKVAERLATEGVDAIYVTTLRRTQQTAEPLARRTGIEPRVEADLREVFLGEWEGGLLRQMAADQDPLFLRVMREQRWELVPGAEPRTDFGGRLRRGVERIAAEHAGGRVLVFSHGAAIGEILAQATGSEPFAFVGADNTSISRLVVAEGRWVLRGYNDTAHLAG